MEINFYSQYRLNLNKNLDSDFTFIDFSIEWGKDYFGISFGLLGIIIDILI